jgi:membrane-associated phospholipid phosphatase
MEEIHRMEIIINIFLQSLGGWLVLPMQLFSALGQEEFYMVVLPAIYWCANASLGVRIGFMLLISTSLNSWLKLHFATPRPYWIDARVKGLASEITFGLPSGHAMESGSLWGYFSSYVKKRWLSILVFVVVFMIGVSRIALGVHFTSDVVVGWLAGGLLLLAFLIWEKPFSEWIQGLTLQMQLLMAVLSSLGIVAITLILQAIDRTWNPPAAWLVNEPGIAPLDPSGLISLAGTWLGLASGLAWVYKRHGFLAPAKSFKVNLIRYAIGIAGVVVIWFGLGAIFPRTLDAAALGLRYVRYSFVGGWVGALGPLVFMKLKV